MSNIDPSNPTEGQATTQSVRDNFQAAADEIDALVVVDGELKVEIDDNTDAILINAGNIGQNSSDIAQNTTDIADRVLKAGDVMTGQLQGITPVNPPDLTRKDYVDNVLAGVSGVLTGSIQMWAMAVAPFGYLLLDGSAQDTTAQAALFAVLGYTYGGAGASFNLPDYRGEFLRGTDNGRGLDPDAAGRTDRGDGTTGDNVGTAQPGEFASHTHTWQRSTGAAGNAQGWDNSIAGTFGQITSATGGNETRPVNINVNYIIKT